MILDTIIAAKRKRLAEQKRMIPLEMVMAEAKEKYREDAELYQKDGHPSRCFARALSSLHGQSSEGNTTSMAIIAEVKKASPSKGVIATDFDYRRIAAQYEALGASAISVLTEEDHFLGSPDYLMEIRKQVRTPLLRKDFIIDPYQIYEAKVLGADAILLIVRLLEDQQLKDYLQIADSIGLDCLVEVHDEAETERAIVAGAGIIGINNRDLQTFKVSLENSCKLRALVPSGIITVSESGIHTAGDIQRLRSWGFDAVLIGEAFMRADDMERKFTEFMG